MTGYDVFAILVILASAGAGFVRGGVREVITLLSAMLAAFLALIVLPWTAPLGRALVDPDWAGSILAAVGGFLLVYFGLRTLGALLSKGAKAHPALGGVNSILGLIVGTIRALVLIGAVHLVIVAALPGERTPHWLSQAALQPVSAMAARAIQVVLPGIGRGADALSPVIDSSVRRGFSDKDALPAPQTGPTSRPEAP